MHGHYEDITQVDFLLTYLSHSASRPDDPLKRDRLCMNGIQGDYVGGLEQDVPWLLLQKVVTDCPGDFSWGRSFDPEVVEFWKFLRFRVR